MTDPDRAPFNPAPDKEVYWSDQSCDEMYCPFMVYSVDREAVKSTHTTQAPRSQDHRLCSGVWRAIDQSRNPANLGLSFQTPRESVDRS